MRNTVKVSCAKITFCYYNYSFRFLATKKGGGLPILLGILFCNVKLFASVSAISIKDISFSLFSIYLSCIYDAMFCYSLAKK